MSLLQKYAEAIQKAQTDRDNKLLAIICNALGVEPCIESALALAHRVSKHRHHDRSESFFVDGKQVAYATFPTCSQAISEDGLATITATYHLSDETLGK